MKKRFIALLLTAVLVVGTAATALADTFPDVDSGYWGYDYIEQAAALGLLKGNDDGTFDPEGRVTYAQFCAMLTRLLFDGEYVPGQTGNWYDGYLTLCRQKGVLDDIPFLPDETPDAAVPRVELARMIENALTAAGVPTVTDAEEAAAAEAIPDIGEYSPSEASAIEAVYALGIMKGKDESGNFVGRDKMTRAEAAAVLIRMYDLTAGTPENPDGLSLDAQSVYDRLTAMKDEYPEGTPWTNDNTYVWYALPGVRFNAGGCAAFAAILSDAAFGDLPARKVSPVRFEDVRPGDILRINNNTHSVIVLEVLENSVIIAEGNFNSSVHWGRDLPRTQVESADYMYTRYPE